MRVLIRQSVVCLALALAVVVAVRAEETLRITPFISDNHVVVSFELDDAYNDAVREAIASGLRTTFTYELELRAFAWIDRTIGTTVVSTTIGTTTSRGVIRSRGPWTAASKGCWSPKTMSS